MLVKDQDSIYLGEAYEKVLFSEDYPDASAESLLQDFTERVRNVIPRCEKVSRIEWECKMGFLVKLDENARTLDPSDDVDESNWREKWKVVCYNSDEFHSDSD